MKLNSPLRILTTAVALMGIVACTQVEKITDAQRTCVQRVLKNFNADRNDVQACLTASETIEDDQVKKELSPDSPEAKALFAVLKDRFNTASSYRPHVEFTDIENSLAARRDLLWSLYQMEETGGKPDVIDAEGNVFVFADVSEKSPEGRRNLNYDEAEAMADTMGVQMMDEATYRRLQAKGRLDTQTYSWLLTYAYGRPSRLASAACRCKALGDFVYEAPAYHRHPDKGFRSLLRVPKSNQCLPYRFDDNCRPDAQVEKMTDDQRACVQRVLKNPNADAGDIQACVAAEASDDDPDKKELAPDSLEAQTLFTTIEARFSKKTPYRPGVVKFADVKKSLEACPDLLYSLNQMEKTGGQPDVIAVEGNTFVFADVSKESPEGRRDLDYDQARTMADGMGVEMMDESTYRELQAQFPIDMATLSWLLTDAETRAASGDALDGARRHGVVYVRWGWADGRVPSLGFRGLLRVPKS